jgi:DNA processing protein
VLFVRGDPKVLSSPQLAIVGSRNPTPTGAETAYEFAAALAEIGWVITSGLAIGIDSQAHRGALAVDGRTVAVLASGADQIYPPQHHDLAESVASAGAYLSELPIGTPVRRQQFPSRNRIISGLSVGTLVVEAARRSGSLITARHAADQGREVFAIPGSIHSPVSRGCHQLIREGAKLVESVEDIVNELGAMLVSDAARRRSASRGSKTEAAQPDLEASYHKLLDCISYDPVSVDALVHRSGLTAREVSSMLLMLELQGRVTSLAGGLYTRSQSAQ